MDKNIETAVTFKDVRLPLMVAYAANRTLWGYAVAISQGVKDGKVAMDGELRAKLKTVRKAGEIGIASINRIFKRLGVTPPDEDPKLNVECVTALCVIMAEADRMCLQEQAKETK